MVKMIQPVYSDDDAIFNRYDKIYQEVYMCIGGYRVPVHLTGKGAEIGIWMLEIPENILEEIIKFIFLNFHINYIRYKNGLNAIGDYEVTNHWKVKIAESKEELWGRLSKKGRYNIKSSIRKLEDEFGAIEYYSYDNGEIPSALVERYFSFKMDLMGTDYNLSPIEYIEKFYVTNAYEMKVNDESVAILSSNELCNYVYLENLTYNAKYSKFSCGMILYIHFLESLIEKRKTCLFLGDGNQIYKTRFHAVEDITYTGVVYRNTLVRFTYKKILPRFGKAINMMKCIFNDKLNKGHVTKAELIE